MSDDEFDANHERREALTSRACVLMGWDQKTWPIWGHLRKVAMAQAVVVGLDKFEELLNALDAAKLAERERLAERVAEQGQLLKSMFETDKYDALFRDLDKLIRRDPCAASTP